jgi:outer membrane protein assembly complex protein YaeT
MMQVVPLAGLRTQKVLVILLCIGAGIVSGAVEDYEGKPVASIAFDPKLLPAPASELAAMAPLKKGEPLRMTDVRATIERLFATGRYDDIVVDARLENGQVAITFLTKGNWFVGQVAVEGVSAPPSSGQMVNATELNLGGPFRAESLTVAASNLKKLMASNGLFESDIVSRVTREDRTQQANIYFEIVPGRRARFAPPAIKGEFTVPESKVVRATHWKGWFGWQRVTGDRTQSGLQRVQESFQGKNYLMARVTLDELKYDPSTLTVTPYLQITQGPLVRVEARGAKVSRDRLKKLIPVFEEQTVDRELLLEGARQLTEYFQSKGYPDTKVNFTSEQAAGGQLHIQYSIARGDRHKLVKVFIEGNRYFDRGTVRERMLVAEASLFQLRNGRYSASLLERDRDAITALYQSNGFREVKVTSRVEDDYGGKAGAVAVFIEIQEGRQWFVSSVAMEGVSPENDDSVRAVLQSGPGQPFSEANMASDRDNILGFYYNHGYPDAAFEYRNQESDQPGRMELSYKITEGPRYLVREVLIGGLKTTLPQLVNQRIGINVGDPVSQAQMFETQRRLYDLGIFAKVETAVQNPDGVESSKNINVQVEESKKYSAAVGWGAELGRIGGGGADLTTPTGQTGFSPRGSLDLSRLNFLGRAHTVTLSTRLSTLQQRALVRYVAPQIRGRQSLDLSFTALFDSSKDLSTFSARRWEGSTQIAQRWTRSRTLFYKLAYRRVSISTVKISNLLVPLLSQPVRVGVFSVGYVDDRRDDPVDSHRGTYNSLDLGVASRIFGSQTDYFRLAGRNSTYHRLGSRLVLARTLSFGMMTALRTPPGLQPSDRDQDIPLPERFFSGGASSLRAFPENQAGPRDLETGFPLGGKALFTFSTELRFPLFGQNIGGVLFHDAGNVYSSLHDISFRVHQRDSADFNYMVHAAGFGVRYKTPVGPVRMDFSFSPNSPRFVGCSGTLSQLIANGPSGCPVPTDQRINRFQFHFSLGQTF